ncbi:MAG: tetratricopeptide repeat protein [Phycisphaerales bacterium]|nr:tetratricopeptide repeat protein [Phycisphaerales bacterium]
MNYAADDAARDYEEVGHQAAELMAMRRMLSVSRGTFSLSFAVCNSPALREHLIAGLRESCPGIAVVSLPPHTADPYGVVQSELKGQNPDALFITDMERTIASSDKQQMSLRSLNASRELWERRFRCPVVLWVPEYAATLLSTHARDFWRYRSHRFEFVSDRATAATGISDHASDGFSAASGLSRDEKQFRIAELEQRIEDAGPSPAPELVVHFLRWLNELAFLYGQVGQLDDAERVSKRMLDAARSFRLEPALAPAHSNLGNIMRTRGDLDGALERYREAERIWRKALGDDHPNIAHDVNNIGTVLHDRGDLDGALERYREAERIWRKALGDDHPNVAVCVNNIGSVLKDKGDLDGALERLREAERIDRAAFGDDHPKIAIRVNNIGSVLRARGDLDGALERLREAERIFRKALGDDHPNVATCVNNIGSVLQDKGDLDGALEQYREAERIDRAAFGDDHPSVASDVNNIGGVLLARGDRDGARRMAGESLRIFIRTHGPRGLNTVQGARNYAGVGGDPIALAREAAGDDAAEALREAMDAQS